MAATCPNCGAPLPDGAPQCLSCLAFVKPQGFLQRLLGGFKLRLQGGISAAPASTTGSHFSVKTTVKRSYKIRDAATGEVKEYQSLDEVPAQYREMMNQALQKGQVRKDSVISLTGPDGVARTYRSLDEVPADMRALIERAEKDLK